MGKTFVRSMFVALLALVLQGCASMGQTSAVSKALEVQPGQAFGEVIGSITHPLGGEEPAYMRYALEFRHVDRQAGGFFALTNTLFDPKEGFDVGGNGFRGKTFRQALPPGEYELTNFSMSSDTGQVSMRFYSKSPFSVRFTVGAGEVVYLGRFHARGHWGRNLLNMKVPDGGHFDLQDRFDEDLRLASAKGGGIDASRVRHARLEPRDHARLFLRPEWSDRRPADAVDEDLAHR